MGITKTLKTIKNGVDNIIDLLGGNIKPIPNDGSMSAIFVYVNSIDPENPSLENASFKVIDVVPFIGERTDYNPVMATLPQSDVDALCQLSNYGFGSVLGFVVKSDIPFAKGQIVSATQLITEGFSYAIKERLEGTQDYRSNSNSKISGWGGSFSKRLGNNLFYLSRFKRRRSANPLQNQCFNSRFCTGTGDGIVLPSNHNNGMCY